MSSASDCIPKVIRCANASEFWDRLSPETPLAPPPRDFVYRGQADADWHLVPSVLRHRAGNSSYVELILGPRTASNGDNQIWSEHLILQHFIEACDRAGLPLPNDSAAFRLEWFDRNSSYLDHAMKGSLPWPTEALVDVLALAQHHGLPTRLLDWTRRAHVAVYFAAVDAMRSPDFSEKRELAVWALDLERRGLMRDLDVVRVPGSTSRNIAPQQGLFTLWREKMQRGQAYAPQGLDQYLAQHFAYDPPRAPLWKLTVSWAAAPELLVRCDAHGINGAILFPGYDGAAKNAIDTLLSFDRSRAMRDEQR